MGGQGELLQRDLQQAKTELQHAMQQRDQINSASSLSDSLNAAHGRAADVKADQASERSGSKRCRSCMGSCQRNEGSGRKRPCLLTAAQ
eukprot:3764013-Rhodomonas_salina.2